MAIPAVLLTGFTITMPRDIGLRYLLPVIALWAAAAGALVPAAGSLSRRLQRVTGVALTVLLASAILATAGSFPGSLAWTAWPFRPAYAMVTDSNVDWGQGLYALRSWSAWRHSWVAYFGPRGLGTATAPGARPLLGTAPARVSGWVAVSATALTSADRPALGWLRSYCPVGLLAGSILIYHFREPPTASRQAPSRLGRALPGPVEFSPLARARRLRQLPDATVVLVEGGAIVSVGDGRCSSAHPLRLSTFAATCSCRRWPSRTLIWARGRPGRAVQPDGPR